MPSHIQQADNDPVQTGRAPAGSLIWMRCMAPGQNTAWMRFYIGIHEYEG